MEWTDFNATQYLHVNYNYKSTTMVYVMNLDATHTHSSVRNGDVQVFNLFNPHTPTNCNPILPLEEASIEASKHTHYSTVNLGLAPGMFPCNTVELCSH